MQYDFSRFVTDFSERTWSNYYIIDKIVNNASYEGFKANNVTQLLNSLLGLLVLPQQFQQNLFKNKADEGDYSSFMKYPTEMKQIECIIKDLKKNKKYFSNYNEGRKVYLFLRHMRNAIAHSSDGIWFYPIDKDYSCKDNEISAVIFHDKNDTGQEFCVELSIPQIITLAESLSKLISKMETMRLEQPTKKDLIHSYKEKVETFRKLMDSYTEKP